MELIDLETTRTLSREDAAAWLRELADQIASQNSIEFMREGLRFTVEVPKEVEVEVEFEIEDGESSLEFELNW